MIGVPLLLIHEMRRLRFVVRVRLRAALKRSTVDVKIERGVRFTGPVDVTVYPRSATSISIGRGTMLGRNVRLLLDGGSMVVGRNVQIRAGVVLHIRGRFEMADRTMLSYYSVVHCDESVILRARAALGEHLTITDSRHLPAQPGDWWLNQIETAPVVVGEDTWAGSKVTISRGVTIGPGCVIAAGSVVSKDVEADTVVGGVPARRLGPSDLRKHLQ